MPSSIAWLDASREDQRKMREIINLFSQSESRDELGIGQVRDAFSDLLFPGTSTLHTRAKYLLFIPWCYRSAAHRASDTDDLERRTSANERKLIKALYDAGATEGLIGRQALTQLKTLPSSLYWSALTRYGVLVGDLADELRRRSWHPEADEVVERQPAMWDVLPVPEAFPESADSLDLTAEEANWCRERMLSGSEGSLLAVLLEADDISLLELPHAWEVPTEDEALTELRTHARLFSGVVRGAALSYNLALARAYESAGYEQHLQPVARYQQEIDDWRQTADLDVTALAAWQLPDFWTTVLTRNSNISWGCRQFVESWVDLMRSGVDPADRQAVDLVCARERSVKKRQSRLDNPALLRTWSGGSGVRPLAYRWSNVQRLVGDVIVGRARASA